MTTNEFTPTPEQARAGYASDPVYEYHHPINAAHNERRAARAFDRMLDKVRADAVREALTGDWANAMRKVVEAELTSSSRQDMIRDNPRGWAENTVMAVRAATLRMIH